MCIIYDRKYLQNENPNSKPPVMTTTCKNIALFHNLKNKKNFKSLENFASIHHSILLILFQSLFQKVLEKLHSKKVSRKFYKF